MKRLHQSSKADQTTLQNWMKLLLKVNDQNGDSDLSFPKHTPFLEVSEAGIQELLDAEFTVCNQQVIIGDVNRTRSKLQTQESKAHMVQLLSLYCTKAGQAKYIQGMNELLAPIYFLEQEAAETEERAMNLCEVFNCFSLMIAKLLPTTFMDDEFISLQCFFAILEMLLKYHAPGINFHLTRNSFGCELYAMPWIVTYFAVKLDLPLTYRLWTQVFQQNDKLFILFFSVALIKYFRKQIFSADPAMLPQVVTNFTLTSNEQVDAVVAQAKALREETPNSFCLFVESTGIFSPSTSKHSYRHILTMLQNSPCIPIFPEELLHYAYPESIECSNPKCYRSFRRKIEYQEELMQQQQRQDEQNSPKHSARLSTNPFLRSKSPVLRENTLKGLLRKAHSGEFSSIVGGGKTTRTHRNDLGKTDPFLLCTQRGGDVYEEEEASPSIRINESLKKPVVFKKEQERFAVCGKCRESTEVEKVKLVMLDCRAQYLQKEASLPNCVMLDISSSFELIQDMLEGSKGIHHLCLIGLSQVTFAKQEWSELIESITASRQAELSESSHARYSTRSNEVSLLLGTSAKDLHQEDFHDKMQIHLICELLSRNFPYVSYLSGGFQHCHDLLKQYNLELNDHHDKQQCFHCTYHDRRGERLWQKSSKGRVDLLDSIKSTFSSAKSKLTEFMQKNMKKIGNSSTTTDTSKNPSEISESQEESSIHSILSKTTGSSPSKTKEEIKETSDIDLNQINIATPEESNTERRLTYGHKIDSHRGGGTPFSLAATSRHEIPKMFGPRKQITTSMMKPQLKTFQPSHDRQTERAMENVSPDDLYSMPDAKAMSEDSPYMGDIIDEGTVVKKIHKEQELGSKYLSKELVLKICDCEAVRVFDCSKVVLSKNKAGNTEIAKCFEVFLILRQRSLLVLRPVKGPKEDSFTMSRPKSKMMFEVQNKLYLNELERITARVKTAGIITLYFLVSKKSAGESGVNGAPPSSVALIDDSVGDKHNRSTKNRIHMGLSFEFKKIQDANEFTHCIRECYRRVKPL